MKTGQQRKTKSERQVRNEKIISLLKNHVSSKQVAQRMGLNYELVRRVARQHGLTKPVCRIVRWKKVNDLFNKIKNEGDDEIIENGTANEIVKNMRETFDPVCRPAHYCGKSFTMECRDVIESLPFFVGSAIKYLWRADQAGEEITDLRKAAQCLRFCAEAIDRKTVPFDCYLWSFSRMVFRKWKLESGLTYGPWIAGILDYFQNSLYSEDKMEILNKMVAEIDELACKRERELMEDHWMGGIQ